MMVDTSQNGDPIMRDFLAYLTNLGHAAAREGLDPRRAHEAILGTTRSSVSTRYAMKAYHDARAQHQARVA
jgi:hypothetical protein